MNDTAPNHDSSVRDVFPYLCVRGAAAAIDFYTRVFGAQELMRLADTSGRIAHAELQLGPVIFMLAEERPEGGWRSPLALGGTGALFHLHVTDVDGLTSRAVAAGATVLRAPADEVHGGGRVLPLGVVMSGVFGLSGAVIGGFLSKARPSVSASAP